MTYSFVEVPYEAEVREKEGGLRLLQDDERRRMPLLIKADASGHDTQPKASRTLVSPHTSLLIQYGIL
jgi:hypothetical protein